MVWPSSLHAMECRGFCAPTEAATLFDRLSSSISCSSSPADARTCEPVRKLTELAAACRQRTGGNIQWGRPMTRRHSCFVAAARLSISGALLMHGLCTGSIAILCQLFKQHSSASAWSGKPMHADIVGLVSRQQCKCVYLVQHPVAVLRLASGCVPGVQ